MHRHHGITVITRRAGITATDHHRHRAITAIIRRAGTTATDLHHAVTTEMLPRDATVAIRKIRESQPLRVGFLLL